MKIAGIAAMSMAALLLCLLLAAAIPVCQAGSLPVAKADLVQAGTAPAATAKSGPGPAGAAGAAPAQANPDQAPDDTLPVCSLAPGDDTRLTVEPCRPAAQQRRRAVPQIIEPVPQPASGSAHHPGAPPGGARMPRPASSSTPSPLNGCDAGGCRDAAGVRYNGGVGHAVIGADGRVCNRNGAWLQCF